MWRGPRRGHFGCGVPHARYQERISRNPYSVRHAAGGVGGGHASLALRRGEWHIRHSRLCGFWVRASAGASHVQLDARLFACLLAPSVSAWLWTLAHTHPCALTVPEPGGGSICCPMTCMMSPCTTSCQSQLWAEAVFGCTWCHCVVAADG